MLRQGTLAVIVISMLAAGSMVGAQNSRRAIPMSGTVVNAQGLPVANANVGLNRRFLFASGGEGAESVAQGRTDEQGDFSLGVVALDTDVSFPLETGVRFDYSVFRAGVRANVTGVTFTAPREGAALASVSARITVR